MEIATGLPKYRMSEYRFSAVAVSICLSLGWPQFAQASCTLTPTAGNDNHVCDSGMGGPLTDLLGNNSLTFPTGGTGQINGTVTFGAGADALLMDSGTLAGTLNLGDGTDSVRISNGVITGAVNQGNQIDDFVMTGGTIQSLAQGDSRDTFLMTGGTVVGAFEDGDVAKMTGGTIGRVDMKLDNNLFDMSAGQILGNLVTGFGTDTIIVSGGRIGGNISVSGGNDSITVTGGEIVGEIRASVGDDIFNWSGGIIRSPVLMGEGNDIASLTNLSESTLALTPGLDGGLGTDTLNFKQTTTAGASRYTNWETVNLTTNSSLDLQSSSLVLGDSASATGVINVDATSTLTSTQGSIVPFTAGQLATLNNAGTIDLTSGNSRTNDTLTVQGNYAGNGGKLLLQSVLGEDNSASDKLVVNNGTLTGSTVITVQNLGGAGGLTQQNGIQLVEAQGSAVSNISAFALNGGLISAGAFDYRLFKGGVTAGTENSWYLRSAVVAPAVTTIPNPDPQLPPITVPVVPVPVAALAPPAPAPAPEPGSPGLPAPAPAPLPPLPEAVPGAAPIALYRPEVPNWSVLPPAAAQLSLMALGTFHDRQGDQRLLTETGAFGAGWGRAYGKDLEQTWAGTVTPKFDGSIKGYQVGNDIFSSLTSGGQTQRTGFFVGHSSMKGNVDGFNQGFEDKRAGKIELRGDHVGLYWTLVDPTGWYFDNVIMATRFDGDNRSERGLKLDTRGHGLTLSSEAGYPFAVTEKWVVEPQVQIIHQKISLDSQDDGISRVDFDSDGAWTGRLGARLKGSYQVSGRPLEPYLRVNLWRTLSGSDTVTFDNVDQVTTEQKASSADVGLGVNLSLAKDVSVYAGADYSTNIDSQQLQGVSGNLGVRISW
ncbi:autotransporter outer membrane beta-barrel domain-containing protein [Pseudomonas mandelii]|uniref:autotransporter family protein n=1 Tax=Pseudomonas mandelii TaxID=75612 RepID=UPI00224AF0A7|nr:autotransporter outer membrane beta-barrel domain-containing protein [Pseudomonas mandelii]MCX2898153.1 autotransporter outer membrane beta-barrel domain-containing protein [Pseudomonas mandelii]